MQVVWQMGEHCVLLCHLVIKLVSALPVPMLRPDLENGRMSLAKPPLLTLSRIGFVASFDTDF